MTRFLGDGRSKQEKLESLLSIPDRVSEEGKSEGFSFFFSCLALSQSKQQISSGGSSKEGSSKGSEVSVRERSEDDSRKVHPFIRAILKKEKSEDIAKEIIGAHLEDQKREIGPDEQNVGKEINRITENLIEVTDYLGTDLTEDLRHVQSFNQRILSKSKS